jgi:hypothetical protein
MILRLREKYIVSLESFLSILNEWILESRLEIESIEESNLEKESFLNLQPS